MSEPCWQVDVLITGSALRASSVLARRGSEVAIFDTGLAHHAASLVAALAAHRLTPDDVTVVFNTHAHIDHSHNNALFERARILSSARDRQWTRELHEVLAATPSPVLEDVLRF